MVRSPILMDQMTEDFMQATKKVDEESQKKMSGMLGGLGLPPGLL